jgi:SsrA-binding protein
MSKQITNNRKAYFEYQILESYVAGIQLMGSEVKSIKANNVNISEAFCIITNSEIFIRNMHVSEHKQGGKHYQHEPLRERKLLLRKKEINNLSDKVKQKGLTIVPLAIILSDTGFIKFEIGLGKGKKTYDKRESLKEKDLDRDLKRKI